MRDGRERLDALYRQYTPGAFGLAYVLVHDREIAQDLVHDAFVNTAARLHQLRDPEAFGAYLRRAVAIGAASRFRRHKIEAKFLARESALRVAANGMQRFAVPMLSCPREVSAGGRTPSRVRHACAGAIRCARADGASAHR